MINNMVARLPNEDGNERRAQINEIKNVAKDFYKDYNATLDQKLLSAMLEMYYYTIPKDQHPAKKDLQKMIENRYGSIIQDGHRKGWYNIRIREDDQ